MQNIPDDCKKEILPALDRLFKDNGSLKSFHYFEDTAYAFAMNETAGPAGPEVVVLGTGVPEILLRAFRIPFRYLPGGSHAMTAWSDDLVPRDTDPVSRSILGSVYASKRIDPERTLFLIPVHSDSMRKIAYLLKEDGFRTFTLDIPPDHADGRSVRQWEDQLVMMADAIAAHTHKRLSLRGIRQAARSVSSARFRLSEFVRHTSGRCDAITGSGRMLVRNSYFFAGDLDIWSRQLAALQQETAARADLCRRGTRPRILLTGSPVFFPNYKVPFLIEDAGLSIEDCIDASAVMQEEFLRPEALRSMRRALHVIADSSYRHEASPAFVLNDALMDAVCSKIRGGRIDGVIFHILKGQIEYDFELERMTPMFEYYDIPVFRLETDYQQQDVEQLRIRLEAFCEMLTQARRSTGKNTA